MTVVERTTEVPAPAGAVWARVTSVEGVQHELRPWLRMTVPRAAKGISLEDVELNRPIGRSWVLALGVIPFDYDDVTLVERGPGMRFLERSPMGSMRLWQHERLVEPQGEERCTITAWHERIILGTFGGAPRDTKSLPDDLAPTGDVEVPVKKRG